MWLLPLKDADVLGDPQLVSFPKGQTYDVYTGPGKDYKRSAEGKAQVSTNGWVQVFGRDGDWIMIQYNVNEYANRVGYIPASALPRGVEAPQLSFRRLTPVTFEGFITDDPLRSFAELVYVTPEDAKDLTLLGNIGEWSYVEYAPEERAPVRGFIHAMPEP